MAAGLITLNILDGDGTTRTARFWSSDGTTAGLLFPAQVVVDSTGTPLDYTAASPVEGSIAHDSPVGTAKPVVMAGRAASTNTTAVSDGDVVRLKADLHGRQVTAPFQVRDQNADANITITSSTAATDLLAAGAAGVFRDLISVTLTNTSATATEVQILNSDGTTVRWAGYVPAGDMRGIAFPTPLKGSATATKWQAKTVTSVASVKITVQYIEVT